MTLCRVPKTSKKLQFHKSVSVQIKDTHLSMMVTHSGSTVSAFLKVIMCTVHNWQARNTVYFIITSLKFTLKK